MKQFAPRILSFCFFLSVFTSGAYAQQAGDTTNDIPEYFRGRFEVLVPHTIDGTVSNVKASMECGVSEGCTLSTELKGRSPKRIEKGIRPVSPEMLEGARKALFHARAHRDMKPTPATAWYLEILQPLLNSNAKIDSCIDLPNLSLSKAMDGAILLCKLDESPWNKPVELLLTWRMADMSGPDALFWRYEISPLFKAGGPETPQN